jgi:hypothetical protein
MAENTENKPVRSDGLLNTGLTSAAQRRAEDRARRQRELREGKRAAMTPGGAIIKEWIDKEIAEAADLRHIIVNIADEEHVKAQLLGRQYYLEALQRLKSKTTNVLREVKVAEKQARAEAAEKSEVTKAWEAEAAEK